MIVLNIRKGFLCISEKLGFLRYYIYYSFFIHIYAVINNQIKYLRIKIFAIKKLEESSVYPFDNVLFSEKTIIIKLIICLLIINRRFKIIKYSN